MLVDVQLQTYNLCIYICVYILFVYIFVCIFLLREKKQKHREMRVFAIVLDSKRKLC